MRLTDKQVAQFAAMRRTMDNLVSGIGATDEATFNAAAAKINDNAAAIRVWRGDIDYKRGELAVDPENGVPYWAMHDHGPSTGQVHQPSASPTIWAHCHGTSPETARPFVAEGYNPYNKGHYCTEGDAVYRCVQDNNVFAPSVYPQAWEEHAAEDS